MKPIARQYDSKGAFTIVELLTVMSIIVILIGLLVPGLNMAKRFARKVTQKNQFHGMDAALELFNAEWEGYPESGAKDPEDESYCGAMKLCEAMVGQDLKGFHPDSLFRLDGTTDGTNDLYPDVGQPSAAEYELNIKSRNDLYLPLQSANAYSLSSIYGKNTGPWPGSAEDANEIFVLCDEYSNVFNLGSTGSRKIGMPVLYYKADISKTRIYVDEPTNTENIYDYTDNDELVQLGIPWGIAGSDKHPMDSTNDASIFYKEIRNGQIPTGDRPYRPDSYILMSAGYDGEYGSPDDIFNFNQ